MTTMTPEELADFDALDEPLKLALLGLVREADPLTQEQLADYLGTTIREIRHAERRGLARLRRQLHALDHP